MKKRHFVFKYHKTSEKKIGICAGTVLTGFCKGINTTEKETDYPKKRLRFSEIKIQFLGILIYAEF